MTVLKILPFVVMQRVARVCQRQLSYLFQHESSGQTIWHHRQLFLTGLFCFCIIYLELLS